MATVDPGPVPLRTIARSWARLGTIGFGGPPAHIALLRQLCVVDHAWQTTEEFEHAVAVTNLLPGPASTQLAILSAWRLRGPVGAVVGGICFIAPGLVVILGLSALFFASDPPRPVLGAAAGLGGAVPAVAIHAATGLIPAGWKRAGSRRGPRVRWLAYLVAGSLAAVFLGPLIVLVLAACGIVEISYRRPTRGPGTLASFVPALVVPSVGGPLALAWVALKVGALSYGGGFVIIPLMQHDAVAVNHWMTDSQFLSAVALGQITPGPVVLTVAPVGFAAAGFLGALLATMIAFGPSFLFVIGGAPHLERLSRSSGVQAFLTGAGAAAIGAILGAAVTLGLAVHQPWRVAVLGAIGLWLLVARRPLVPALLVALALGVGAAVAGLPVS